MRKVPSRLSFFAGPATLALAWQLAATSGAWEKSLFPPPSAVATGLLELARNGFLAESIAVSAYRFGVGFALAAIAAFVIGVVAGRIPLIWRLIGPAFQALRPVSPIAWMPFVVLFLGIGDRPAIAIIFIAAFFPVLVTTVAAMNALDPSLYRLGRALALREPALTLRVLVPAALPQVLTGVRISTGTAWVFLVAGEMAGCQSGLGFLVVDGRNGLRYDIVLGAIAVIGAIGLALDRLMHLAESRVRRLWGLERSIAGEVFR